MLVSEIKLNKNIIQILKDNGITELTEIQEKTFPSAANGHDVIGVSKTGSGKTLAFILPTIQQVLLTDKPFYTLILTPTRELAVQIDETLKLFESLEVRHVLLCGGDNFNEQAHALSKKPHIVVGTPGRVVKHMEKTKSLHIERIRKLVLDEADRFFEQDFADDLEKISKKLKMKNQTLMFTATITDRCRSLAGIFMRTPKIYNVARDTGAIETIADSFIFIPEKYKIAVLYNYLQEVKNQSVIVFVALCTTAQKIGMALSRLQMSVEYLHGKMPQAKRSEIMKDFRDRKFGVLVATDVASRGLDIPHVGLVINYDLPDSTKTYIHRIGRTGRAGKEGTAVSFVTQYDVEGLQKIEHGLKKKIEQKKYENYSSSEQVKEIFDEVRAELNATASFR